MYEQILYSKKANSPVTVCFNKQSFIGFPTTMKDGAYLFCGGIRRRKNIVAWWVKQIKHDDINKSKLIRFVCRYVYGQTLYSHALSQHNETYNETSSEETGEKTQYFFTAVFSWNSTWNFWI